MKVSRLTGDLVRRMMQEAARRLELSREEVNALNVFPVPDGDTGTNMLLTLQAALAEMERVRENDPRRLAQAVARGALMGARGNSGVILSQILRGFARGLEESGELGPERMAQALQQAAQTAYRAVIRPVEGTILSVARAAGREATKAAEATNHLAPVFQVASEAARQALARTPEQLAVLREAGVVDAGGRGYVVILEAFEAVLTGDAPRRPAGAPATAPAPAQAFEQSVAEMHAGGIVETEVENGYCTEFIVRGESVPLDALRARMVELGDSVLVVGDPQVAKVHVHTEHPGQALEFGLRYGELLNVSVGNMREQNREAARKRQEAEVPASVRANGAAAPAAVAEPPQVPPAAGGKTAALQAVAVAVGEGMAEIFASLGVAQVVKGGQSMNPSTQEIFDAVESCPAEHVVILPNNGNVIFTANQVTELTARHVHVIPTRSIPQGLAAMLAYEPDRSVEENLEGMRRASEQVRTGEITYAVRDSQTNGLQVNKGDIIGLVEGDLVAAGPETDAVVLDVLGRMVTDESEVVSLYYGADVSEQEAEAVRRRVEEKYPHLDAELYAGRQPLYYYILSVE